MTDERKEGSMADRPETVYDKLMELRRLVDQVRRELPADALNRPVVEPSLPDGRGV